VLANAAIIPAGLVTGYPLSAWPDLIFGLGIALINALRTPQGRFTWPPEGKLTFNWDSKRFARPLQFGTQCGLEHARIRGP